MRTTITLDPDVARELKRRMRESDKTFKDTVNEALRRGLAPDRAAPRKKKRFVVESRYSPFRPGVDSTKLKELVDQLDVEAFFEKERRGTRADNP